MCILYKIAYKKISKKAWTMERTFQKWKEKLMNVHIKYENLFIISRTNFFMFLYIFADILIEIFLKYGIVWYGTSLTIHSFIPMECVFSFALHLLKLFRYSNKIAKWIRCMFVWKICVCMCFDFIWMREPNCST